MGISKWIGTLFNPEEQEAPVPNVLVRTSLMGDPSLYIYGKSEGEEINLPDELEESFLWSSQYSEVRTFSIYHNPIGYAELSNYGLKGEEVVSGGLLGELAHSYGMPVTISIICSQTRWCWLVRPAYPGGYPDVSEEEADELVKEDVRSLMQQTINFFTQKQWLCIEI